MAKHQTPAQKRKSESLARSLKGFTATEALRLGKIASGGAPKGDIKQLLVAQQRRLGLIPPDPPSATRPPPTEPTGFPIVTPVGPPGIEAPRPGPTPIRRKPRGGLPTLPGPIDLPIFPPQPPPRAPRNKVERERLKLLIAKLKDTPRSLLTPVINDRNTRGRGVQANVTGGAFGAVPMNTETRSKPRRRRSTTGPRPAPRTLQDKIRSIRRERQNLFA